MSWPIHQTLQLISAPMNFFPGCICFLDQYTITVYTYMLWCSLYYKVPGSDWLFMNGNFGISCGHVKDYLYFKVWKITLQQKNLKQSFSYRLFCSDLSILPTIWMPSIQMFVGYKYWNNILNVASFLEIKNISSTIGSFTLPLYIFSSYFLFCSLVWFFSMFYLSKHEKKKGGNVTALPTSRYRSELLLLFCWNIIFT